VRESLFLPPESIAKLINFTDVVHGQMFMAEVILLGKLLHTARKALNLLVLYCANRLFFYHRFLNLWLLSSELSDFSLFSSYTSRSDRS